MEGRLLTPFSMGIFASRGSGKTHFVRSLLLEQERFIHTPFKKVLWIYKSWQDDFFKELNSQTNFMIEFVDDIPNTMVEKATVNTLIVIDDLMEEATNSPLVESLFTRGHHLGLSVVLLSQNQFHKGK
jgi:DNA helicase HerA-like ATPase